MSSLFGGGLGRGNENGGVNPQNIEMAVHELEMITDVFNKIVLSCHTKCISQRYAEAELNKGESVCIDRCVAKFFEVNKKVGERLQQSQQGGAGGAGGAPGFGL